MQLTEKNYFSVEMDKKYFSVSQYKSFKNCSAKALYDLEQPDATSKEAFLEGKLFESFVTGNKVLFLSQHPEIVSSRGATAGEIKSNFKRVIKATERFLQQDLFNRIIKRCEKQKILTGIINGVEVKCALDLFDLENGEIYDIKCMSDFKDKWSDKEKKYVSWYYFYDYVLQLAIYREVAKQNFNKDFECYLIAATKEEEPDLQAIHISKELLDLELEEFKNNINLYNDIKLGKINPNRCEICEYCKKTKIINKFEEVK